MCGCTASAAFAARCCCFCCPLLVSRGPGMRSSKVRALSWRGDDAVDSPFGGEGALHAERFEPLSVSFLRQCSAASLKETRRNGRRERCNLKRVLHPFQKYDGTAWNLLRWFIPSLRYPASAGLYGLATSFLRPRHHHLPQLINGWSYIRPPQPDLSHPSTHPVFTAYGPGKRDMRFRWPRMT